MNAHILLVEDDAFLREGLEQLLTDEGYRVCAAENAAGAEKALQSAVFDLVILDVRLPDESGLRVCRRLRCVHKELPVLFLTACDDENEIVDGFDAGGDDYVTKPFGVRVLLSRIRALLRRNPSSIYESGSLYVDMNRMTVRRNGEPVFLTPTEFQILSALIRNRGIVVTRGSLLSSIWDCDGNYIDDNTLSVHISRLREKIGAACLVTVRGVGYRWEENV